MELRYFRKNNFFSFPLVPLSATDQIFRLFSIFILSLLQRWNIFPHKIFTLLSSTISFSLPTQMLSKSKYFPPISLFSFPRASLTAAYAEMPRLFSFSPLFYLVRFSLQRMVMMMIFCWDAFNVLRSANVASLKNLGIFRSRQMSSPNNSGKRSLLGALSSWEDAKESLKKQKSDAETQDKQRKEREKKLKNEQESRAASIPELKSSRKVVEEYVNEELVEEDGFCYEESFMTNPLRTCSRSTEELDPDELKLASWPPWFFLDELGNVMEDKSKGVGKRGRS